ncbi:OB-fold nucleic acid binding domain-containing protein [Streptomyces sp. NPDC044780]|uniref:OB-fold nucleic acid binding domain-containing protein n=1 Tax=unclassified Streptomyces TaxID=2593676 RepID=UPI0034055774
MTQPVIFKANSALIPQCQPATEPASAAGIIPALQATPNGALVHLRGLITAVVDSRHHAHHQVTISDTTGSAVVYLADKVTYERKDELKVGRVLGVVGCCASSADNYDVVAAAWQTTDFALT